MLSEIQKQVVDGSLLGDAWIHVQYGIQCRPRLCKSQSQCDHVGVDKISYMHWHCDLFGESLEKVKPGKSKGPSGKLYPNYTFRTKSGDIWDEVDRRWYTIELIDRKVKRTKIVPKDLILTPLSLCVWYMDDGTNNQKDANVELCTEGFTLKEVDMLCGFLKRDLGIESHPKKDRHSKKNGDASYKVFVGRESYFQFIDIVKTCHVWYCFKYKIDTSGYTKVAQIGEDHSQAKLTTEQAIEIANSEEADIAYFTEKYNLSKAAVSMIRSGRRWGDVTGKIYIPKKLRLNEEKQRRILELLKMAKTQKEIAREVGCNQATVSRLNKGRQT